MANKWMRAQYIIAVVIQLLGIVYIISYPFPIRSDDTWWGWNALSKEVLLLLKDRPGYFLAAQDDHKTAAVLHFTSGQKVYSGNIIGRSALQFSMIDKDAPPQLAGKNAIVLDSQPRFKDEKKSNTIHPDLQQHFATITELDPILIRNRKGKTLRKFLVYECKGYKQ